MYTGEDRDRRFLIDRLNVIDRKGEHEVDSALGDRLHARRPRRFDIGDFLKALGAQQCLSGILRGAGAHEGGLKEAHRGRFERRFRSKQPGRVEQPECTGR